MKADIPSWFYEKVRVTGKMYTVKTDGYDEGSGRDVQNVIFVTDQEDEARKVAAALNRPSYDNMINAWKKRVEEETAKLELSKSLDPAVFKKLGMPTPNPKAWQDSIDRYPTFERWNGGDYSVGTIDVVEAKGEQTVEFGWVQTVKEAVTP